MSAKSKAVQAITIAVVLAAAIIGGVTLTQQYFFNTQTSKNTGTQASLQTGTLAAQITDPPHVPAGVTHVYVNYSDIQVHLNGVPSKSGWYTVVGAGSIDLMSVVSITMTLGSSTVTSGLFTLVKFDITGAIITIYGQNSTAIVPLNQMVLPISNGGVLVSPSGSSGFLIDVSPTVVPFQNGTQTGYVLVPAARSLAISSQIWHKELEQPGSVLNMNSSDWWNVSVHAGNYENFTIESATLTPNLLSVTVKNTGHLNTTLTTLSIFLSGPSGMSGGMTSDVQAIIAAFHILPNGTAVQLSSTDTEDYPGLVVQPGGSVTITYHGSIGGLTVEGDNGATLSSNIPISANMPYVIKVVSSSGASAQYIVDATSG